MYAIRSYYEVLEDRVFLAGNLLQCALPVLEIVLGLDFLRDDQVVACLCLVRIGDRRGADLEIALGLRQLLGGGNLLLV